MKTRLEELDELTNEKMRKLYDIISSNCTREVGSEIWNCMCEYVKVVIERHDAEKAFA